MEAAEQKSTVSRDYLRIWNQFNLLLSVHVAAHEQGGEITMLHKFLAAIGNLCLRGWKSASYSVSHFSVSAIQRRERMKKESGGFIEIVCKNEKGV